MAGRSRSEPTDTTASRSCRRLSGPTGLVTRAMYVGGSCEAPAGHDGAMTIRVFLLDDHEVVRRGIRELLESEDDMEVVGEAGTAEEAYGRIPATTPDVAVLDVRLPDGDGVEVCREVRSRHPEIACIMLTSFADDEARVRGDHGRRRGVRPEAGPGHRPGRRDPAGRRRRVAARPGGHDPGARAPPRPGTSRTSWPPSPTRSGPSSVTSPKGSPTARSASRCSSPRRR